MRIHTGKVQVNNCEGVIVDLTARRHPIVVLDAGVGWQNGNPFTILVLGCEALKILENQLETVFK